MTRIFVLCVALAAVIAPARAADWTVGGHVKYQYNHTNYRRDDLAATLGDDPASDHDVDVRLKADGARGPWDVSVHYELLALQGDTVATRRNAPALAPVTLPTGARLPDDRRRLFDLTETITDRPRTVAIHRLDRLSVGHTTPSRLIRFGRQVVTWGNGLVFYPLDFVNPFSPIAIDKEYKTGDDMLYAQWTFATGGDFQAIVVPRRDVATRDVQGEESTYAAKMRVRLRDVDIDLLGARHFDDDILGMGLARSVGGAVWRLDAAYVGTADQGGVWSFVTNVDYSWTWGARNVYGYAEYFRNGFGENDRSRYASPTAAAAVRIERGELYTLARDYVALGIQVALHPLLNVATNVIWNANDASRFLQLRAIYDWQQNIQLIAGANLPSGDRGDEFGGIALTGTGLFLAPGHSLYARVAYYF